MSMTEERYMVDGVLRTDEEVTQIFRPGLNNPASLGYRQRVAIEMVARAGRRGRLLDVGCYAGTFLEVVARLHPDLDWRGVDAYPDNIKIARLLYPDSAERFEQQSVYSLDFPDRT